MRKKFYRDVFIVQEQVLLSGDSCIVDKGVGIGRDTSDTTDYISAHSVRTWGIRRKEVCSRVKEEDLLAATTIATVLYA